MDVLKYESELLCYLQKTEDCREGITALIKEREPVFCGR